VPDFSWCNIPKRGTNVPNDEKCTKGHKLYQMAVNRPNAHVQYQQLALQGLQNLPELVFLVGKYTIWQPCAKTKTRTKAAKRSTDISQKYCQP
jgi:hypothetical protein